MAELYRAADLFTLGSLKEMMPVALLEALASGLPCVVHRHPVMQWMIGPGGTAVDLSRTGGWAEAVAPLLRTPTQRAALGQQARAHCLQHFSRDRVVAQILDYYNSVLGHA
jgi:glycosyltransferase involved in cell wall biosynthesis